MSLNPGTITRYVRFLEDGAVSYGVLEDGLIRKIRGGLFGERELTGETAGAGSVKLLYPCEPRKILCVGLNYRSHLHGRPEPRQPEMFYKPPTALQNPEDAIIIPGDARDCHFEGELVAVIGRRIRRATAQEAAEAIFGYTCGNDVSERTWQRGSQGATADKQWWRAKGCDTFGPCGPAIAAGWDYRAARLTTRLNGETAQSQGLSDLIFPPEQVAAFVSRYVTLEPGDLIFTGTPGSTRPMKDGDTVEVEIGGLGVLSNRVRQE